MKIVGRLAVFPVLPDRLSRLYSLAYNLWWMWNPQAMDLYRTIDPTAWETTNHNAVRVLSEVKLDRLKELEHDAAFLAQYDATLAAFDAYMAGTSTSWYASSPDQLSGPIAYFSAEFGLHESLPIYSGGLGILAGDHNKETSDLGLPFIGIGFLYPQGYFRQRITRTGDQEALYERLNFADLPAEVARDVNGNEAMISVDLHGRRVFARIWKFQVGRNPLFLMDTDVEENDPRDRVLSARLYGGDQEMRIAQEIVLGIGGVRALRTLGITPSVWHLNESHSAFVGLERVRELVEEKHLHFREALNVVASCGVFTTHTPVPAGNDAFSFDLMDRYFRDYWPRLGLTRDEFMHLAQQEQSWGSTFSMTVLAMKATSIRNGVSQLHGAVSRRMWQFLWPDLSAEEVPITHITNGVHSPTWIHPQLSELYARYLDPNWLDHVDDHQMWTRIEQMPDTELWNVHQSLKKDLVAYARLRHQQRSDRLGEGAWNLTSNRQLLSETGFTIGFARRFATYKRATLLFRDRERLLRLLNIPDKPVQIIFAGKSHPADEPGRALIRQIEQFSREPEFAGKIVLLEEYDMDMARHLVSGVDLWLNTPIRPYEASGTSGEKAALNAIPNCSVLDGWWDEGFNGHNGWSVGDEREYINPDAQDAADADSLYTVLERQIVPTFYERDQNDVPHAWVHIMKEAARTVAPAFSMKRMIKDYFEILYVPAARAGQAMNNDDYQIARALSEWERRVRSSWPQVKLTATGPHDGQMSINDAIDVIAVVELDGLNTDEVAVELVWGKDDNGKLRDATVLSMIPAETLPGNRHRYAMRFIPTRNGSLIYGVRVRPHHAALQHPNELGLMTWASI